MLRKQFGENITYSMYSSMNSISNYFQNTSRIGSDQEDSSQRNSSNTKSASYVLENYLIGNPANSHVDFATKQANINFSGGGGGVGIPASAIDADSRLIIKGERERSFDRLQLNQRPFATVPYLGKGSNNPVLESQLQQGESISNKKSQSTIMDKAFIDYTSYPLLDEKKQQLNNPASSVEDSALKGWVRGGIASRKMDGDVTGYSLQG